MNIRALSAALALSTLAMHSASAATLTAVSLEPANYGGFTIQFTDTNGNSLFDIPELASFSGFTTHFGEDIFYSGLLAVPTIAGISVAGEVPGAIILPGQDYWFFDEFGSLDNDWDGAGPSGAWTYQITGLTAPVSLPAGLPLLAGGLGAIALLRRRAKG